MPRNNMPAGWQPAAPAWQSVWRDTSDPLVAAYFGIQANEPMLLDNWASQAFCSAHAPASVERGMYTDQQGVANFLYIAYWRYSEYQRWWAIDGNGGWWADNRRLTENAGYWREIIVMPFDRFETLHSTEIPHGIGVTADDVEGPIAEHGYAGGMRDRIQLSATDPLKNNAPINAPLQATATSAGKRVVVTPPQNMCVIRSGQNWSFCDADEKAWYLQKLHPVLQEGMRFLRDNPLETNCYSLRFVDKKDDMWGTVEQSFGLGYATDVYAFENWAKSHPTHIAIFGGFMDMVETFGEGMKLRLWHEVTALPRQGCEFEYIACHQQTGLLNYS